MNRILISCVMALALSGCFADGLVQDTSREAAKRVVTPIITDRFPGRNTEAYSNCVIDNATTQEIFSIAKAAVAGADADTVNTVVGISTRTDTLKCFVRAEIGTGM